MVSPTREGWRGPLALARGGVGVARRVGSGRVIASHAVAWREFARARRIENRGSTRRRDVLLNRAPRFTARLTDSSLPPSPLVFVIVSLIPPHPPHAGHYVRGRQARYPR